MISKILMIYLGGVVASFVNHMGQSAATPGPFRAIWWQVTLISLLGAVLWPIDVIIMPVAVVRAFLEQPSKSELWIRD